MADEITITDPTKMDAAARAELLDSPHLSKIVVAEGWTPDERAKFIERGFRALRSDELPCISAVKRPDDYAHDLDRGSVEFHADWHNYSFLRVAIPDGTVVRNCNFRQASPNTGAISGKGLVFEDCSLINVRIDPSWKTTGCNNAQAWLTTVDTDARGPRDKYVHICQYSHELKGDEKEPENVVKARDF